MTFKLLLEFWKCDVLLTRVFCSAKFEDQVMLPDVGDQTDHRQWTQQHLDAADLRAPSMAPTPPQGEIDADCMDVNVRGPGMMTIQTILSSI